MAILKSHAALQHNSHAGKQSVNDAQNGSAAPVRKALCTLSVY